MGDDDRSFISLKKKGSDDDEEETNGEQTKGGNDDKESGPHSAQNSTGETSSVQEDIVAGSRSDDDVEEAVMNASVTDATVPISLILAGNVLVITVIALFEAPMLWMIAMGFACVEVLVGAALWYVHHRG